MLTFTIVNGRRAPDWKMSADLLRTREIIAAKKGRWQGITRNPRSFHAGVSS
jgi:hypothetical protein